MTGYKYQTQNHHHQKKNLSLDAMAGLQRFKLLATQCGVAPSPTRSPRTSPLIHLRRRRITLRSILLGRRWPEKSPATIPVKEVKSLAAVSEVACKRRNSLEELFYSPPLEVVQGKEGSPRRNVEEKVGLEVIVGVRSERRNWNGFRHRALLMRRVWRPMLLSIPE